MAIVVALLIFRGRYRFIEIVSLVMIGLFTLFTFACAAAPQDLELRGAQERKGLRGARAKVAGRGALDTHERGARGGATARDGA